MSTTPDYEAAFDLVNGIQEIKYERSTFDVAKMKHGKRDLFLITKDGTIEYRRYEPKIPIALFRWTYHVDPTQVSAYYSQVINCMQTATRIVEYIDDSTAKLTIVHHSGEIVLPRGLENGSASLASITGDFLSSAGIKW